MTTPTETALAPAPTALQLATGEAESQRDAATARGIQLLLQAADRAECDMAPEDVPHRLGFGFVNDKLSVT